jgi:hypothetical protein
MQCVTTGQEIPSRRAKVQSELWETIRTLHNWIFAIVPSINTTVAVITTPTYNSGVVGMAPLPLLILIVAIVFVIFDLIA